MRDLQDWYKNLDFQAKAAERMKKARPDTLPPAAVDQNHNGHGETRNGHAVPSSPDLASPPRKGRGPRKEETYEELLSRLLDPMLTLEETARLLQVCPTTVRRYTNKGVLPHERSAGNQRRFRLRTVLAFKEAQLRGEPVDEGDQ